MQSDEKGPGREQMSGSRDSREEGGGERRGHGMQGERRHLPFLTSRRMVAENDIVFQYVGIHHPVLHETGVRVRLVEVAEGIGDRV